MKKTLFLLVALITATITFAKTEINGIYYNLNDETKTAEVTSGSNEYSGDITIPEKVTHNSTEYSVTSIGDEAFWNCSSLTSISIPNSVTSIGGYAFSNCESLTSITIPNSVTSIVSYAFDGCSSLTSITIPNSVTFIGDGAFEACSSLTSIDVKANNQIYASTDGILYNKNITTLICCPGGKTSITIPNSVTSIVDYAFSGCSSLTSITIPNSVTSIGKAAFRSCSSLTSISIPNSVTSIGDYAFDGCSSLTSITIPNNVTSIGKAAFAGCSSLTSITIPNSVTSIGENAFYRCSSLTSITIPNSVTSIGDYAFYECKSLTSITIPNSVTSIGDSAFDDCDALTSISIPNSVTSIGEYAFSSCSSLTSITIPNSVTSIGKAAFRSCSSLTSISIPNSVTSIGDDVFYWCSSLTSITIPNNVTSIGYSAFRDCTSLTSITIPNSVTFIGDGAFEACSSLTSITIPNSVTSIGDGAFKYCSSLTSITIEATTPPTLNGSLGYSGMIYIPDNTLSAYKEVWGTDYNFANNENSLTIHVKTPGTLSDKIFDAGQRPINVTKLTVTGTLNDDDFTCMRETMTSLVDVDLSGITNTSGVNFENKSNLVKILLPENLTSIGNATFHNCSSLTSITIPNSVTSIGYYAFYDCESLTSITCLSSTPPEASDLGANTSTCTLIVPKVAYSSYLRHEYWGQFLTIRTIGDKEIKTAVNNSAWGKVTGAGIYNENDEATLTATANSGYRFVKWSDEVTDNPRTVVVTQDSTFTAIFEANTFAITTAVSDNAMGSVSEGGEYAYGTEITLTATANSGYRFTQWSDGNTDNPRTITVTENKTYTAEFEVETFTITTASEMPSMGGVEVILNAKPIEGFEFVEWTDGNTDNPRILTLTENIEVYARFQIAQSGNPVDLETSKISSANIYTTNGTLHVEGATDDYHILDAAGRLIYSGNATTLQLPRGIYLVTINGEVEKIVL